MSRLSALLIAGLVFLAAAAPVPAQQDTGLYDSRIRSGKAYAKAGKYLIAEAKYKEAIAAASTPQELWSARFLLKDTYIRNGQYRAALAEIDWLLQNGPGEDARAALEKQKRLISGDAA